jgi:hypothetical protein
VNMGETTRKTRGAVPAAGGRYRGATLRSTSYRRGKSRRGGEGDALAVDAAACLSGSIPTRPEEVVEQARAKLQQASGEAVEDLRDVMYDQAPARLARVRREDGLGHGDACY